MAADKNAAYRARRSGGRADMVVLGRNKGIARGLTEDYLEVRLPVERAPAGRFSCVLSQDPTGTLSAEAA